MKAKITKNNENEFTKINSNDFLFNGSGELNETNNEYDSHRHVKKSATFIIKVFMWYFASCSVFANLIFTSMCIFKTNNSIGITMLSNMFTACVGIMNYSVAISKFGRKIIFCIN